MSTHAVTAQEPLVVALLELGVDLLHRLQADADHDQDARYRRTGSSGWRRSAGERDRAAMQGDEPEVERARERDARVST